MRIQDHQIGEKGLHGAIAPSTLSSRSETLQDAKDERHDRCPDTNGVATGDETDSEGHSFHQEQRDDHDPITARLVAKPGEEETEPRNRRRMTPSRLTEIYDAMTRVLPPLLPAGMTVSRIESSD